MVSKTNQTLISILLVVVILMGIVWIIQRVSISVNFKALMFNERDCRKEAITKLLDPEAYLRDLDYGCSCVGGWYCINLWEREIQEPHTSIIAAFSGKEKNEIKSVIIEQCDNNGGKKVKDIVEFPLDFENVDIFTFDNVPYSEPFFIGDICYKPKFLSIEIKK